MKGIGIKNLIFVAILIISHLFKSDLKSLGKSKNKNNIKSTSSDQIKNPIIEGSFTNREKDKPNDTWKNIIDWFKSW